MQIKLKAEAVPNPMVDDFNCPDSNSKTCCQICTKIIDENIHLRSLLKVNENAHDELKILYRNTQHVLMNERRASIVEIKSLRREIQELSENNSKQNMELAFLKKTIQELRNMYDSNDKVRNFNAFEF